MQQRNLHFVVTVHPRLSSFAATTLRQQPTIQRAVQTSALHLEHLLDGLITIDVHEPKPSLQRFYRTLVDAFIPTLSESGIHWKSHIHFRPQQHISLVSVLRVK